VKFEHPRPLLICISFVLGPFFILMRHLAVGRFGHPERDCISCILGLFPHFSQHLGELRTRHYWQLVPIPHLNAYVTLFMLDRYGRLIWTTQKTACPSSCRILRSGDCWRLASSLASSLQFDYRVSAQHRSLGILPPLQHSNLILCSVSEMPGLMTLPVTYN
jgi:hypothetical protein